MREKKKMGAARPAEEYHFPGHCMGRLVNAWKGLGAVVCLAGLALAVGAVRADPAKGAGPGEIRQVNTLHAAFRGGLIHSVMALGDSVTQGYRLPEGWPEILGRDLAMRFPEVRVINAGRAGDTASDGLTRLERDVLALHPGLVLVSFGLNEAKHEVPTAVFRRDLKAIVSRLRKSGARVALLTTTRPALGARGLYHLDPEPYNRVTRDLAASEGVPLVDVWRRAEKLNRKEYLLDLVHPNARGHRELARIIAEGLLR